MLQLVWAVGPRKDCDIIYSGVKMSAANIVTTLPLQYDIDCQLQHLTFFREKSLWGCDGGCL